MLAMVFPLCSPPSDFLAVYLFGKYRTDTVLKIASVISFIGGMIRYLAVSLNEFWPVLVGTLLMASVGSIFLNAQIIIANKWFPDNERAVAMAILNIACPIGSIASFILSGMVYDDIDDSVPLAEQNEMIISSTERLIWY